MPWNNKSLRLRYLRDRLRCQGPGKPTFSQSVETILEIISLVQSKRNLAWARRNVQGLRDRTPDPSVDQLAKLALLDARLERKLEMANTRKARRAVTMAKKKVEKALQPPPKNPTPPAPGDVDVWDL